VDNHGHLHGLNLRGLKRRGFSRETINALRGFHRQLFHGSAGTFDERLSALSGEYDGVPEVRRVIEFIHAGEKRPLCMPERS
jgi:UDP-N-acetylglucosamine acyltransferase